ncbi:MAG TPA: hypothetical protein VEL28_14545 [Candidatus Binatia bacterium]|nr:hypothetical protein [Candidatus Binatia bacterium]
MAAVVKRGSTRRWRWRQCGPGGYLDPKGWKYKDAEGAADGAVSARIKPGDAGNSTIKLEAKGGSVPMPMPVTMSEMLTIGAGVAVQLHNSDTGACWTASYESASTNAPTAQLATLEDDLANLTNSNFAFIGIGPLPAEVSASTGISCWQAKAKRAATSATAVYRSETSP